MILDKNELLVLQNIDKSYLNIEKIAKKTNLHIDLARRIIETLHKDNLIDLERKEINDFKLTYLGKKAIIEKLPQEKIILLLKEQKEISIPEVNKLLGKEASIAIGLAKRENLINIENGKIKAHNIDNILLFFKKIHENLEKLVFDDEIKEYLLKNKYLEPITKRQIFVKINPNGEKIIKNQKNIKTKELFLTKDMLKYKTWKNKEFKPYNVEADVEELFGGKYQPYLRFLDLIRKKMISLGFEEMPTHLITNEFYNYDVLFQPQNHTARTWTDTYSLKTPSKSEIKDKKLLDIVKNMHENGGKAESKGWQYKWNPEIAKRLMPVAQGTAFSAKQMIKGVKIPGRYFAIARVYRPDVLDATHLNEFNQLEGFVVAKEVNFKHLLGLLKRFALEVAGAEDVVFFPDYYPFTEPSVQISAKHPKLGWVEFGGAGMFRPEITENLGIKERIIAWGFGIDRLAMFNLGIKDIRKLFSQDIKWLREQKILKDI